MQQYLDLAQRIINEGVYVDNKRTGVRCLTVLNHTLTYDVSNGELPLVTTRKSFWKAAVAELLGYLRGYTDNADFVSLGANTWTNNSLNPDWTSNPNCRFLGDLGNIYGYQGYNFNGYNQYKKVYENLKEGIDDRGEIITFWNPSDFDKGCLRPCMYSHHFSILGDTLYLTSTQRSVDVPLGLNFNMVQCAILLAIMAQITNHKVGSVTHNMVNCHIYENQVDLMAQVQLKREPLPLPTFKINPRIKTWDDVLTMTTDDVEVFNYQHHDAIKYPFTV